MGRGRGHALNRALDIAGAGTVLLVTSPLIGLAALAVKLEDGGPVFYRQVRVGQGGRARDVQSAVQRVPSAASQVAGTPRRR